MPARSSTKSDTDSMAVADYNDLRRDAMSFFYPASTFKNSTGATKVSHGDFDAWELTDGNTESIRVNGHLLMIPANVYLVVISEGSGTKDAWMEFSIETGPIGQQRRYLTININAQAYAVDLDEITLLDITTLFTKTMAAGGGDTGKLKAGYWFGLDVERRGGSGSDTVDAAVNVIGLLVES